jgi:hypothetical protein
VDNYDQQPMKPQERENTPPENQLPKILQIYMTLPATHATSELQESPYLYNPANIIITQL